MSLNIALQVPIFLLAIVLTGCATPLRAPEPPPVPVADEIWWQIDSDIASAAQAATRAALAFARRRMELWRQRVTQKAEADFIPWYSSYWAQQWMTARVAWYTLNAETDREPPVSRLAAYLQEQYHQRVLAPVAQEVDPASVIAQATELYVQALGAELQAIQRRYGVPQQQFERRLQGIAAIAPSTSPAAPGASLQQLLMAKPVDSLPSYAALLRQVREGGGVAGAGLSKKRISPVALRVSERMLQRLAIGGGASAASALVGGVAGSVISFAATAIGVAVHESERGAIESELRTILNESMDAVWLMLMEESGSGVTAGIHSLASQIEHSLQPSLARPMLLARPPEEIPLPEAPLPEAGPFDSRDTGGR